jgi:hypothetical protein
VVLTTLTVGLVTQHAWAVGQQQYVQFSPQPSTFPVANAKTTAAIYVDANDWPGVLRAANDLSHDIRDVTGKTLGVISSARVSGRTVIIIGTIGKSRVIDQLIDAGKIDASATRGKWESSFTQVVRNPLPGVDTVLIICGAVKRGTIYGIDDLSEEAGQSPWYYWADVPAKKQPELYVKAGSSRLAYLKSPVRFRQG